MLEGCFGKVVAVAETVRIDSLAYGSSGVGRLTSGKAVFVDGTVPGDTVEVEL
ncbi:MAG: TRAM domain-containing protein, partial [Coriobacteriia bacterium]|nr:TRAM domain-containing protein [Coriobacteriia bacterium]